MSIIIVGTGHILNRSVREVRERILEERPDTVAVELDVKRFRALESVDFRPEEYRKDLSFRDYINALRGGGGSFPVLMEIVLSMIQQDLGKKYGLSPGSDMCAAILTARDSGSRIALIDRDIGITLNHIMRFPLKEMFRLYRSSDEDIEIASSLVGGNLEGILDRENLEPLMDGFRKRFPTLYDSLVDERDQYMAQVLTRMQEEQPEAKILAVVGAGHARGINTYLGKIREGYRIDTRKILRVEKVSPFKAVLLSFMLVAAFILIKIQSFFNRG